MSANIEKDLDRYDALKVGLSALYKEKMELEGLINWPPVSPSLDELRGKLTVVNRRIALDEVELTVLKARLPPPPALNPADDWVNNPQGQRFDADAWEKRQREEREKARKMGRPFTPDK